MITTLKLGLFIKMSEEVKEDKQFKELETKVKELTELLSTQKLNIEKTVTKMFLEMRKQEKIEMLEKQKEKEKKLEEKKREKKKRKEEEEETNYVPRNDTIKIK